MISKRAVAFDIGDRRIGVAVSDPFNEYAMPSETYFRTRDFKADVAAVAAIAEEKGAGVIVCGMPVNFDGSESVQTEKTRAFVEALKAATSLPVELEDERFTTMQARETQIAGGVRRGDRKKTVDSIAASYILESYLSRMKKRESERRSAEDKQTQTDKAGLRRTVGTDNHRRFIMTKQDLTDEEYEDNIVELEDDEGNVESYVHVGTIEYKGEWYCFFQKAEPETEEEEDEIVEFRLEGEGENQRLLPLDDEALMDEVFAEFCNRYEQYEDSDDAMRLDGGDGDDDSEE